jgi:hypothetical protein
MKPYSILEVQCLRLRPPVGTRVGEPPQFHEELVADGCVSAQSLVEIRPEAV